MSKLHCLTIGCVWRGSENTSNMDWVRKYTDQRKTSYHYTENLNHFKPMFHLYTLYTPSECPKTRGLSPFKKICFYLHQWKLYIYFKNFKKCFFFFHVKSSFHFWDIFIYVLTFLATEKNVLIRKLKGMVNFKIYDVTAWKVNNYNTHIAQYLKK